MDPGAAELARGTDVMAIRLTSSGGGGGGGTTDLSPVTSTYDQPNGIARLDAGGKLKDVQVPTLIKGRSSWNTLHLDRDFSASYDATYGHWSGALDELAAALAEGGTWTMDPVDHPVAKPVPIVTKAQQKFIVPGMGPFWAYLNNTAGYVKGARFTALSASAPNGLGVSGKANGFIGDCLVYLPDYANNGGTEINNIVIDGLSLDGASRFNSDGAAIMGIKREGLVRGAMISHVSVSQTTGSAFADVAFSGRQPRGGFVDKLCAHSAGNTGDTLAWGADFHFTDGRIGDLWVVDCTQGIKVTDPGQVGGGVWHSVFNNGTGVYFTGGDGSSATGNGGGNFAMILTDGNDGYGVLIDTTGRNRLTFGQLDLRRDGRNGNTGADGTDKSADPGGLYAALGLIGSAGNVVCPVHVGILSTAVEDDDSNNKVWSPHQAVRVNQYISEFAFNGYVWGYQTALNVDNGGLDALKIGDETTSCHVGRPTAKVNAYPDIKRGKTRSTPIFSTATTFTAMPSSESTYGSLSNSRLRETATDLRGQNYGRIGAKVVTSSTSASTPVIYAQASTDGGTTWTTISGTCGIGSGTGGTAVFGSWLSIPAAMKTDVIIRCASAGGDGSAAPSIQDVVLQTRP